MDKILPGRTYNYCPKCGSKLKNASNYKTNFCCYCGHRLKTKEIPARQVTRCTICHEFIWLRSTQVVKCSFCGSKYHNSCVYDWLVRYNACPMCQNVFLKPNLVPSRKRK